MELSVGTAESGVGVAPGSFSGVWVARCRSFCNVATMFAVPALEATFPASGLSFGVYLSQENSGQFKQLFAGSRFRVQR